MRHLIRQLAQAIKSRPDHNKCRCKHHGSGYRLLWRNANQQCRHENLAGILGQ
ncbi:hypothetical protein PCO82_08590 [Pectobacteriaceae bacterium CE90]|nr:hypothetical protein [Prodigiosinella sp. LS101]WJV52139.1 hypothetical protein PCO85_12830 [Prodigiosinella sp. LS101]WJV56497.1 hypothetical protein PCO84_12840 [Pectobacteriaceae bacterium C111]WJY16676.1 hypothetical protein PCO82_08590 [Pectobacteriaceae bacterium CE90]